ncbi:hypothetical protein LC55x_3889 [Lysobacter capsici]|nr:hypothetical protein LC55x_3889 [Lysobacter capsici]
MIGPGIGNGESGIGKAEKPLSLFRFPIPDSLLATDNRLPQLRNRRGKA